MGLIRSKTTPDNQSGRGGCQVQSPFNWAVYYVTIEHGAIVVRDWGGGEIGRDGPVSLAGPHVSGSFAAPNVLVITIAGFHANTNDSGIDTYQFPISGG